jgi:UDP-N-acetylmuramoyl-L-alanyl-D-glutamate--2,6-diaminopimelate ligase
MKFSTLVHELAKADSAIDVINPASVEITGITDDSRQVKPGFLFAARSGAVTDGARYVRAAVEAGAVALLVPAHVSGLPGVPQIVSSDTARTLGHLASAYHGHPSHDLKVIGITGTNGKTTSACLLRAILEHAGIKCGLMGTIENIVGNEHREAKLTTPGVIEIQRTLAEMRDAGQRACVMEVSSHALAQDRVSGIAFSGALFTNLTRDHLDYHGDFDAYFDAKSRLFMLLGKDGKAVVNIDSEYGPRMAECAGDCITVGTGKAATSRITDPQISVDGLSFRLDGLLLQGTLTGRYNIENVAGAAAVALALGVGMQDVQEAVAEFRGARGRLERVEHDGKGPAVFVDYAHTPDALWNVLTTLREICKGRRLHCVVGCGGDRDATKRPKMAAIAAELADRPIITSDNPRGEDPASIIEQMLSGIPPQKRPVETCLDRRTAIRRAVAEAGADDVVVIVGKGHETYQIFSDRTVHFDDTEEAKGALETYWGHSGSGRRTTAIHAQ